MVRFRQLRRTKERQRGRCGFNRRLGRGRAALATVALLLVLVSVQGAGFFVHALQLSAVDTHRCFLGLICDGGKPGDNADDRPTVLRDSAATDPKHPHDCSTCLIFFSVVATEFEPVKAVLVEFLLVLLDQRPFPLYALLRVKLLQGRFPELADVFAIGHAVDKLVPKAVVIIEIDRLGHLLLELAGGDGLLGLLVEIGVIPEALLLSGGQDEALDLVVFLDDVVRPPVVGHPVAEVDELDQAGQLLLCQLDVHGDLFPEENIPCSKEFAKPDPTAKVGVI